MAVFLVVFQSSILMPKRVSYPSSDVAPTSQRPPLAGPMRRRQKSEGGSEKTEEVFTSRIVHLNEGHYDFSGN